MMKIETISFSLSGAAACFRKPDVNEKVYFTYNNIHKVALMGLLGAIIGLKGYRDHKTFNEDKKKFPEFYEKLSSIKVAVEPKGRHGYFTKKIQHFNNSVGYASKEAGGNLMVQEQWLEDPRWQIHLCQGGVEVSLWEKLKDYLLNNRCVYIPYLGRNDFPAIISGVSMAEVFPVEPREDIFVHSLFSGELDDIDDLETWEDKPAYIFTEYMPVQLQPEHNFYIFERMIYTNCKIINKTKKFFQREDKVLYFM